MCVAGMGAVLVGRLRVRGVCDGLVRWTWLAAVQGADWQRVEVMGCGSSSQWAVRATNGVADPLAASLCLWS